MGWLLKVIEKTEEGMAVFAYATMFLMIIVEIILREVFQTTFFGSETVAILASALAGFFGFSLVTQAGTHLRPNFLDRIFPETMNAQVWRVSHLVSALALGFFAWVAFSFVVESYGFKEKVPVLYWPLWPFQASIAYAFGMSSLKHLVFFVSPSLVPVKTIGH